MKRIVLTAAVVAAALLAVPAPSGALPLIEAPCTARITYSYSSGPPEAYAVFVIEASPPSPDETQPWTTTECTLEFRHRMTPDAPWATWAIYESTVPGPTGFLRDEHQFYRTPGGFEFYVCTRVWTSPVRVEAHHGCSYAFTY